MKKLIFIGVIFIFIWLLPIHAAADTEKSLDSISEEIEIELRKTVSEDVSDELENQGVDLENPTDVSEISPKNVLSSLFDSFRNSLKKPLQILGRIIAIAVICAVVRSLSPDGELNGIFSMMSVLSVIVIMTDSISDSFETLRGSIENINKFMTAYIPIFSSVVSACGSPSSTIGYTSSMLLICEGMAVIASKLLVPFLSAVLGLTLVTAINPTLKFSGTAEAVKKCTVWILGLIMSIFVGLTAMQSFTGAATDNFAVKTIKFAAGSFIPVIGSSVSDAYSAVRSSMGVIRMGVGSIGIIVVFIIAVKPVISVLAIKFAVWLGKIVNDIFGENEISGFLSSTNSVLSIGLAIVVAYAVVFIIATGTVMTAAMG